MLYEIPGRAALDLQTLILDLNGTLSVRGTIPSGVKERLRALKQCGYRIVLFSGDTRGNADLLARNLKIECVLTKNGEQKREAASRLDPSTCVSVGNGLIDLELMKIVKLRIVTLQGERVHVQTLLNSDIVVPSILDALDLLIQPSSLIATLRS